MIYITGDTHGEFGRFSTKRLRKQGMEPGEQDYVIVCGDFGFCWEKNKTFEYHCKYFARKKYTILCVQGNHENYDMIAEYPVEEWHGGKVRHIVRDKVILPERGQVFEIEDKLEYSCWYFGHYHMDRKIDARHILLYHTVVPLEGHGHVCEPAIRAYFLRASHQVIYRGYLSEIRGSPGLQQECGDGEVERTALNEEFMLLGGRDAVVLGKTLNRAFYDEDGKFVTVFAGDLLVLRYQGDTFGSVLEEDVEKIESMLKPIDHIAGGNIFLKEAETLPEWKEKAVTE